MKENDSLAATQKGLHSGETVTPSGGLAHNIQKTEEVSRRKRSV
jgi:hypothetical protein